MSVPQDTPDPGQNGSTGHNAGQYNHPAGAASDYTYPGGGSMPQQAEKGPAPKEVMRAYYLILAAGILHLLTAVLSTLLLDTSGMPGAGTTAASIGYAVAFGIAAVVAAIYVVLAVFIRKGHNWARIVATLLAALNVVSSLASLLLTPFFEAQASELGQPVPETSFVIQAIGVIVLLLGVAGVIMTYLKPARQYFAPRPIGY